MFTLTINSPCARRTGAAGPSAAHPVHSIGNGSVIFCSACPDPLPGSCSPVLIGSVDCDTFPFCCPQVLCQMPEESGCVKTMITALQLFVSSLIAPIYQQCFAFPLLQVIRRMVVPCEERLSQSMSLQLDQCVSTMRMSSLL